MKLPRPAEKKVLVCNLCPNNVQEANWCEGCAAFICEACDNVVPADFEHEPSDHRAFMKRVDEETEAASFMDVYPVEDFEAAWEDSFGDLMNEDLYDPLDEDFYEPW